MSAFSFTLWRFGWARPGVVEVEGWRRLLLRLWWRKAKPRPAPQKGSADQEEVKLLAPKRPVHWCPHDGLPLCGADRREWWTFDFDFATCAECRVQGEAMHLQHELGYR